jgi:hypothetical protein
MEQGRKKMNLIQKGEKGLKKERGQGGKKGRGREGEGGGRHITVR